MVLQHVEQIVDDVVALDDILHQDLLRLSQRLLTDTTLVLAVLVYRHHLLQLAKGNEHYRVQGIAL